MSNYAAGSDYVSAAQRRDQRLTTRPSSATGLYELLSRNGLETSREAVISFAQAFAQDTTATMFP